MLDFWYLAARVILMVAMCLSGLITFISAWLMTTARVYGTNPKDVERSKRIIEAYARVCVVSTLATIVLGILLTLTTSNGRCI